MKKIPYQLPKKDSFENEPTRKNRWTIKLPSDFKTEGWQCQKIQKPKFKRNFFFSKWEDIELEIIDLVGPHSSKNFYDNLNKKNFNIILLGLDPVGEEIERWTISVSRIKSIDFGYFDYGNDELQIFKVKFKVKNCIYHF